MAGTCQEYSFIFASCEPLSYLEDSTTIFSMCLPFQVKVVEGPGYPSPVHLLSVDQILLQLFEHIDLVALSGIS